jgi:hypothetical protein
LLLLLADPDLLMGRAADASEPSPGSIRPSLLLLLDPLPTLDSMLTAAAFTAIASLFKLPLLRL